jgi:hypothetical protein
MGKNVGLIKIDNNWSIWNQPNGWISLRHMPCFDNTNMTTWGGNFAWHGSDGILDCNKCGAVVPKEILIKAKLLGYKGCQFD